MAIKIVDEERGLLQALVEFLKEHDILITSIYFTEMHEIDYLAVHALENDNKCWYLIFKDRSRAEAYIYRDALYDYDKDLYMYYMDGNELNEEENNWLMEYMLEKNITLKNAIYINIEGDEYYIFKEF